MLTKQLNSELLKLFSLYVIFFFVSYFVSLFLSSPCFPFLILVYCTFFPSSVITHERGNYAFCHFPVCWLVSRSLSSCGGSDVVSVLSRSVLFILFKVFVKSFSLTSRRLVMNSRLKQSRLPLRMCTVSGTFLIVLISPILHPLLVM